MVNFPTELPDTSEELEACIQNHETEEGPLKNNNEAKIVWANPEMKEKTEYAIVYLHGFGASRGEGKPWHRSVAKKFGCNLYLPRLHSHGLKRKDYFQGFNYDDLITSTIDACRIGQKLGKKVLIMGTSTGGLLALYAASSYCCVPVEAVMVVSPLIHFYGIDSLLLEHSMGRYITKLVGSSRYRYNVLDDEATMAEKDIWYTETPLNAPLVLGNLVRLVSKPQVFKNVACPAFVGYYHKDASNHDRVVSPHAIERMAQQLGTPYDKHTIINFKQAGTHVIGCGLHSKSVSELITKTNHFLQKKVNIGSS